MLRPDRVLLSSLVVCLFDLSLSSRSLQALVIAVMGCVGVAVIARKSSGETR